MIPNLIYLNRISDQRGNLSFIQFPDHIPFELKRVYWIYDLESGQNLTEFSKKYAFEFILSLSGSIEIIINNGSEPNLVRLNRPDEGLLIEPNTKIEVKNVATNSIILGISSMILPENETNESKINLLTNKSFGFKYKREISFKNSDVNDCILINLNKISHQREQMISIENSESIPFEIRRLFYIYDIPSGKSRGAHSHKNCIQLIIATGGSFEVHLDDGDSQKVVQLNQPNSGLIVWPGIWAAECNFSAGATCLVLTSEKYNELDYIRNYENFKDLKKNGANQS